MRLSLVDMRQTIYWPTKRLNGLHFLQRSLLCVWGGACTFDGLLKNKNLQFFRELHGRHARVSSSHGAYSLELTQCPTWK